MMIAQAVHLHAFLEKPADIGPDMTAIERPREERKRRLKTQIVLSSTETAAMYFCNETLSARSHTTGKIRPARNRTDINSKTYRDGTYGRMGPINEGRLSLRSRDSATCSPPSASHAISVWSPRSCLHVQCAQSPADHLEELAHRGVEAILVHFALLKPDYSQSLLQIRTQ